ncbi:putative cobalt transporter family protein, subunit CbtB [Nitrososphaera viennensis EN76]|mgnify:CR=1 FL=1|nr:putative cobalt transporter family protein, subunit CbtB [Nitrososphaera viennensis EN76]
MRNRMSFTNQIARATEGVPKIAVGILIGVLVFGIFAVGFDQGQLFALAQGNPADPANPAYGELLMHEFTHDMRHAAGFACH